MNGVPPPWWSSYRERQIRELSLEHAGDLLRDDAYLTRLNALREQRDAITERTATGVTGQRAVEWLRALSESIQIADVPTVSKRNPGGGVGSGQRRSW